MRHQILLLALLAAACGKTENTGNKLGELRTYSPLAVSATDRTRLGAICQALNQKASLLGQFLNTNFAFEVQTSECDRTSSGVTENVVLQRDLAGRYVFKKVPSGLDFVFPEVETDVSGSLAQICPDLANLENPKRLANGNVLWFSATDVSSADCASTATEFCVRLETAAPQGNGSYKVHSKEWIRFRIDPNLAKYGFYTSRKLLSSAFCAVNEVREVRATLK